MAPRLPQDRPRQVDWQTAEKELVPHLEPFASRELASWAARRPQAVQPLREASTSRIYDILPMDVKPFLRPPMRDWPFPVGVRKKDWMLSDVENMTGGLPLALGFHRFVESHGRIPTWMETGRWFVAPEQAPIFYGPAWECHRSLAADRKVAAERWTRAINWRIGNAYLSFIREMDFLSRMVHDHGIPLRMHILADAVLKVDFWCGRHAVCLFIPNDMKARKVSPTAAATGFVHDVEVGDGSMWIAENGKERKLEWNEIKQAPEKELAELAAAIREDRKMAGRTASASRRPSRSPSFPTVRIPLGTRPSA